MQTKYDNINENLFDEYMGISYKYYCFGAATALEQLEHTLTDARNPSLRIEDIVKIINEFAKSNNKIFKIYEELRKDREKISHETKKKRQDLTKWK